MQSARKVTAGQGTKQQTTKTIQVDAPLDGRKVAQPVESVHLAQMLTTPCKVYLLQTSTTPGVAVSVDGTVQAITVFAILAMCMVIALGVACCADAGKCGPSRRGARRPALPLVV